MTDFFSAQLLECQWRGAGFPVTSFRVRLSQDTVQHKRPDQDGARVESTGRNPLTFEATIPFYNSLARGPHETWSALYPDAHRSFLAAMADRTEGVLQHPSLGPIVCKPVSCDSTLEAGRRDGELVSASWVEHSEDEDASNAILTSGSLIGEATRNAIDLDTRLSNTAALIKADPDNGVSFEEALRQVAGVIDKASLLSRKSFGAIDRLTYRINAVLGAVAAAKDPQNWQLKQSLNALKSSVRKIQQQAVTGQSAVRIHITPAPTTLGNLASKLGTSVGNLIRLNPHLVSKAELEAKTLVRYPR